MQELTMQELDVVSGGLGILDIIGIADAVVDFCNGVADGYAAGAAAR